MNGKQVGTVFMVSILALAGIGVSYAGLTDEIFVYGTVSTATVDLVVDWFSGTWVWKVWDWTTPPPIEPNQQWQIPGPDSKGGIVEWRANDEVLIYTGNESYKPTVAMINNWLAGTGAQWEPISWSKGRAPEADEINPKTGELYDAVIDFNNIFPCVEFKANIVFHYVGSIPAKITDIINFAWADQWLIDLAAMYPNDIYSEIYHYHSVGPDTIVGDQLHYCDRIKLEVVIKLPQDNDLQGLSAEGYAEIAVRQWNDDCNGDENPEKTGLIYLPSNDIPSTITSVFAHPWNPYYWQATLSGIGPKGSPTVSDPDDSYNVWDGPWPNFCVDEVGKIWPGRQYKVHLYSTYDATCPYPTGTQGANWPYVNYIVNNMDPYLVQGATWVDFQQAIWFFIDGGNNPTTTLGVAIKEDALANGATFIPQEGQLICVLLWAVDDNGDPLYNPEGPIVQRTFIIIDP